MTAFEINFDGLVGPTHSYGGLSTGNLASQRSAGSVSNPRAAARQGLRKMKLLHDLGVPQGVLPPHERPAVDVLRKLGFSGRDEYVLRSAQRDAPELLAACSSASSMWAANAATVCPSVDSGDGKAHFTPANLASNFHRSIEASTTARVLKAIFGDPDRFVHHNPLPGVQIFGDEGAANHTRLCRSHAELGTHLFVYGKPDTHFSTGYPARQSLEASQAIARLHGLDTSRTVFAQQLPAAVDAGVFHNDVIAMGNEHVFILHEDSFVNQREVRQALEASMELDIIEISSAEVTLDEAVRTYLFNSQLVTLPSAKMALIVPQECKESERVWGFIERTFAEHSAIDRIEAVDLRQSMRNGGGPACLRLRVVITDEEAQSMRRSALFDDRLHERLDAWVVKHYRDRLTETDFADPSLLRESRGALDELTQILEIGSIYPFQH